MISCFTNRPLKSISKTPLSNSQLMLFPFKLVGAEEFESPVMKVETSGFIHLSYAPIKFTDSGLSDRGSARPNE